MPFKKLIPFTLLVFLGLTLLSACQASADEPVTFNGADKFDIPTLDPQMAEDSSSISAIENLFLQLTNYDPQTADIVPEAASEWRISPDGLTYTFKIRTDIPWVRHNPATGETSQDVDEEGNPRFLSAHDFVRSIKRACDPNTGSFYSTVVAPLIKGCSGVLFAPDLGNIPLQLWSALGVSAPDDETLIIELEFPAGYFLSMTPMWTLAATPHWAIEAHGKQWIEADNIVTNGRYVLHEWTHDVRRIFLRNPLLPQDLQGDGNIERFVIDVVSDENAAYSLWLEDKLETSLIPEEELPAHLKQFPDETEKTPSHSVSYIGFRMTKPPFDDPRVRRAFSAAFDRETFVDEVLQGHGLPMIHFAPPGIFGAPPIDQVGLGFDPQFARQQLADAGYPDCQGFPHVTLTSLSGPMMSMVEFARDQWAQNLGCKPDLIEIKELSFQELLDITLSTTPDAQAPHLWSLGWAPDYPDENNWVGDVLWCKAATRQKRTCNEIDDLIVAAREDPDPQRRVELYRQIEELFFRPQGEIPLIPVSVRTYFCARHTWLTRTMAPFGGAQWYTWSIDQKAQREAQK